MKVLITGATSGIGAAAAYKFAANGHDLWLTGRRENILQSIAEDLKQKYNVSVHISAMDVRDISSVETLAEAIVHTWQSPDVLINNAGLALGLSTIDEGNIDEWNTMIDTNVKGLLYMSRYIVPLMKKAKSGHVINIGSTAGKQVYPNGNVYCATKHAVDALSESMRIDLLNANIKVTSINPGMVDTAFSLVRFNGDEAKAKAAYDGFEPLHAENVADALYYCASLPAHVCINDLTITCTRQANSIFKTNDAQVNNS